MGTNRGEATDKALIYVIAGKEQSLVSDACRKLLGRLVEPSQRTTGLFDVDLEKVSVSDVLDELRTLPFLTDKRVVLIRDADDFISENRELLEKYFDSPCPTGVLVMTVTSWRSNTRLAKKLGKAGTLIAVTAPKRRELPDRLIQYAHEAHDKNLARGAAELLIELVAEDLPRLYGEIDKIAVFVDTEKTIGMAQVEAIIGHNRIFGVFEVIDAVVAGEPGKAVERLRKMLAEDRSAEYTVVGAFAFHARRMFEARRLLEKGRRQDEIARQIRMWHHKDRFFAHVRQMSLRRIGQYLQQLAETDYAIKRGRATPKVAMEQFVLRLAQRASETAGV